jgi:hypothetical protein
MKPPHFNFFLNRKFSIDVIYGLLRLRLSCWSEPLCPVRVLEHLHAAAAGDSDGSGRRLDVSRGPRLQDMPPDSESDRDLGMEFELGAGDAAARANTAATVTADESLVRWRSQ